MQTCLLMAKPRNIMEARILESLKSRYAMMIWDFDIDGTPYFKKEKDLAPNQVTLTREGEQLRVKQYAEDEGIKMIGIHKALNLQKTDYLKHIKNKTITFATVIGACPIPKNKVIPAYLTVYHSFVIRQ
eukprot:3628514-Ditylum_brightwellii.AAC.1